MLKTLQMCLTRLGIMKEKFLVLQQFMISSSFALFALLSKVKSAALQKMKPGLLIQQNPTMFFLASPSLTLLNKTQMDRVFFSVLQSSSHKIASISFSCLLSFAKLSLQLFFLQLFPFSFMFATTILSPRQKYWSKPITIAESQIEYVPCQKMFGESQQ